jgi:hypothetical protein
MYTYIEIFTLNYSIGSIILVMVFDKFELKPRLMDWMEDIVGTLHEPCTKYWRFNFHVVMFNGVMYIYIKNSVPLTTLLDARILPTSSFICPCVGDEGSPRQCLQIVGLGLREKTTIEISGARLGTIYPASGLLGRGFLRVASNLVYDHKYVYTGRAVIGGTMLSICTPSYRVSWLALYMQPA